MLRLIAFCLISFAVIFSCMGQTFQYSRGWTNGKRSSSHLNENPTTSDIFETQESEERLQRCIIQLQRLINNPYLIQPSYLSSANGILYSNGNDGSNSNRHQSNELFENSHSAVGSEFSAKHN